MADTTNRSSSVGAMMISPKAKSCGIRPNDRQFYQDVLNSNECACGRVKHPKFAFCFRCYNKLSLDLQVDLRLPPFRKEFQEAYEQAVKHLEEEGII